MRCRCLWVSAASIILSLLVASCAPAAAPPPPLTPTASSAAAPTAPGAAAPATVTPKPSVDQPKSGGILTLNLQQDLPSLDMHQETPAVVPWVLGSIYSGLLQYDPLQNDKAIPDLAERWERSADGAVYTFYLRKGVKWHDGKPFTAEDARFSLDRIRKPPRGTRSPRVGVFKSVTNVEVLDESTLRVTLEYPAASFIANMATGWVVMMPKHVIESKGDMKKEAVGTGPFKLKDFSPGALYNAIKNADYFVPGRPYLDGLKSYVIKDSSMRLAAFRTGQVLITCPGNRAITPSQAEMLVKAMPEKIRIEKAPSLNWQTFIMNARVKPWDEPRVRRATSMAIDRRTAIDVLQEGESDVGGIMPPAGQWGFPKDDLPKMAGYRADKAAEIEEARKLLAEAGFPSGFKTTMLVRTGSENEDLAVFVKSQLEKIGIQSTLNVKEVTSFDNDLEQGAFSSCGRALAASLDDPDQIFGEHFISTAGRNYQAINNPKLDDLFVRQSRALDPSERKKLVNDMERYAMEDNGKVTLYWQRERQASWLKVRNYKVGYGIYNNNKYQDVWLAE